MEKYSYEISQHWLNYIFNGDVTDLTDEEVDLFDSWWDVVSEEKQAHISIAEEVISDNFGICEISGLFCNLVNIDVITY